MLHKLNVQNVCDNWKGMSDNKNTKAKRLLLLLMLLMLLHTNDAHPHPSKVEERKKREEISLAVTLYYVPFFVCDSTSLSLSNRSLNYLASRCHFQFCLVCDILLRFVLFSLSLSLCRSPLCARILVKRQFKR